MTEADRKDILLLERVQFILSIALSDIEKTGRTTRYERVIPGVADGINRASQNLRVLARIIAHTSEPAA